jgi:pyruvate ferredoxin oxidoreductase alpha subunit
MIQAYRIAEHKDVRLPIMVCQDGFITSHAVENIELMEDADVKNFVGEYQPENYLLNPECPMAVGPYSITDYYMEAKRNQAEGTKHVPQVVLEVAKEFAEISGREYGLFEEYCLEDADRAVVMIGSAAGTTKDAIDRLRAKGEKVGLLKIRLFRPFPAEEIAKALSHVKAVAIMDRAESYTNQGGPLGSDVMAAMFRARSQALAVNYIYGLGGRDVRVEDMEDIFATLKQIIEDGDAGETYRYLGIRE